MIPYLALAASGEGQLINFIYCFDHPLILEIYNCLINKTTNVQEANDDTVLQKSGNGS
jgi:hypothetical protein